MKKKTKKKNKMTETGPMSIEIITTKASEAKITEAKKEVLRNLILLLISSSIVHKNNLSILLRSLFISTN